MGAKSMRWRKNPHRIAWIVLATSFFACVLLAVFVPLGVRSVLHNSTRSLPALLTTLEGTAQVWAPEAKEGTAVTAQREVSEGSRIITDASARAVLSIPSSDSGDQVLATAQLFPDTAVELRTARTPRFGQSNASDSIALHLIRGRLLISTQTDGDRSLRFVLTTPQAELDFGSGTYTVIIEGEHTLVRARSGSVVVTAADVEVTAANGERVTVTSGSPPDLPVPDALNLILDGRFSGELEPTWQKVVSVPEGLTPGTIVTDTDGQRRVVRFTRRTEDGAHNEAGIRQVLERDVQGYESLVLRLDIRLLYQSVPGGGYLASEYPVMLKLLYTDIYGKDLEWVQGFYYLDLPSGSAYLEPTGEKIPLGLWYSFESANLFEALRDTRPARIRSVSIYASGHDYDSMIADVALTAR
jgi:hypothetical protein